MCLIFSSLKEALACLRTLQLFKICFLGLILLWQPAQAQTYRLYQSTRATGSVQELDLVTGAILATNVGGITDARGMAFSPLGGLYLAQGNFISSLANAAASPNVLLIYTMETPHDVTFDAVGNLYVVTDMNVYVYTPALVQTLTFAHGLTTTTGDGNGLKGWSIAVRPDNGEIFVAGRQGIRRYSPITGLQLGATIPGSSFGMIGLAFTSSGFNNVYLYAGNVISGVDQLRVFDTNLTLLRSFFATHNGNPIDLEINPANNDLYLFNTVVSNPVNRFTAAETVVATFNSAGNPSRGSALGDFNAVLPAGSMQLELQDEGGQAWLRWTPLPDAAVDHYRVERVNLARERTVLGEVRGGAGPEELVHADTPPAGAHLRYVVSAMGRNGEQLASVAAMWAGGSGPALSLAADAPGRTVCLRSHDRDIRRIAVRVVDMRGATLRDFSAAAEDACFSYADLPAGMYVVQAMAYSKTGEVMGTLRKQLRF